MISIVLLFSAHASGGQKSLEAASYLARAETFYDIEDYRNALQNTHLAKTLFEEDGNSSGISLASGLLSKIEGQTTPSLMAGYYYSIGSDYFFSVDETLDPYEKLIDAYIKSKYFARLSLKLYEEVEDRGGELKAGDLMQQSGKKIEKLQNQERYKAMSYYASARASFLSKKYMEALSDAETALGVYTNISDGYGISNTNALIERINAEVATIKKNADTALRTAKEYYAKENYIEALKHAENTHALYESIKDEFGILESKDMISIINSRMHKGVEELKTRAASLYRQAQDDLVKLKCGDALDKAKESHSIYWQLKSGSETEREEDLYQSLINDCNRLIEDIINTCGTQDIIERAGLYYRQAQDFYLKRYYREALSYAEKAESFYDDVGHYVGIAKTRSLIDEITESMQHENAFSQNMSLARVYAGRADFENARIHLGLARSVASKLIYTANKTAEVDELLETIITGEEKLDNAKGHYDRAYDDFTKEEYDNAEEEAKNAINLYKSLNHSMGLNQSTTLYNRIREMKGDISGRRRAVVMSVIIVGLVVFVIVVNYLKKRKEMRRDRELMQQKMQVEKKEEERKWRVEEEAKTKERVEEEFKRIIEEERKHTKEEEGTGRKPPAPPAEETPPTPPTTKAPPATQQPPTPPKPTRPPAPQTPAPPQATKKPRAPPTQEPQTPPSPPTPQQPQAPPAPSTPPKPEEPAVEELPPRKEDPLEEEIHKLEAKLKKEAEEKEG